MNRPQTIEGAQVWDLVIRGARQLRVIPGAVIGFDLGAMMTMGAALGVPPLIMAELLPAIEAVAVQKMNDTIKAG